MTFIGIQKWILRLKLFFFLVCFAHFLRNQTKNEKRAVRAEDKLTSCLARRAWRDLRAKIAAIADDGWVGRVFFYATRVSIWERWERNEHRLDANQMEMEIDVRGLVQIVSSLATSRLWPCKRCVLIWNGPMMCVYWGFFNIFIITTMAFEP